MHKSAYETGGKFLRRYWRSCMTSILEIGSMDVNGTLRDFQPDHLHGLVSISKLALV
jgi:hypothetical protein